MYYIWCVLLDAVEAKFINLTLRNNSITKHFKEEEGLPFFAKIVNNFTIERVRQNDSLF